MVNVPVLTISPPPDGAAPSAWPAAADARPGRQSAGLSKTFRPILLGQLAVSEQPHRESRERFGELGTIRPRAEWRSDDERGVKAVGRDEIHGMELPVGKGQSMTSKPSAIHSTASNAPALDGVWDGRRPPRFSFITISGSIFGENIRPIESDVSFVAA